MTTKKRKRILPSSLFPFQSPQSKNIEELETFKFKKQARYSKKTEKPPSLFSQPLSLKPSLSLGWEPHTTTSYSMVVPKSSLPAVNAFVCQKLKCSTKKKKQGTKEKEKEKEKTWNPVEGHQTIPKSSILHSHLSFSFGSTSLSSILRSSQSEDLTSLRSIPKKGKMTIEQQRALSLILKSQNVFLTGPPGSGKTFLIQKVIEEWEKKMEPGSYAITASTSIAACNFPNGKTLQSFWKLGLGNEDIQKLYPKLRWRNVKEVFSKLRHLVIDEISMLSPEIFIKLDLLLKAFKGNQKPFGGIQVVATGDFAQLEYIEKDSNKTTKFVFEYEEVWNSLTAVCLSHSIRQQDDLEFLAFLNRMRTGVCSKEDELLFRTRCEPKLPLDDLRKTMSFPITCLFSLRDHVNQENRREMLKLAPESSWHKYTVATHISSLASTAERKQCEKWLADLDRDSLIYPVVWLTLGCPVFHLANVFPDEGIVNGTRGKVVGFSTTSPFFPEIQFYDWEGNESKKMYVTPHQMCKKNTANQTIAWRSQIPLAPSFATTIHKSQGLTLAPYIDFGHMFASGQAYTALSRARSFKALWGINFSASKIRVHPKVREYYEKIRNP